MTGYICVYIVVSGRSYTQFEFHSQSNAIDHPATCIMCQSICFRKFSVKLRKIRHKSIRIVYPSIRPPMT